MPGVRGMLLTCKLVGETIVTKEYMRSGAASKRSGRASFMASSSADDAWAGTPYHTCSQPEMGLQLCKEINQHML